ncbi:protein NUCLEAR FUSION DEFECTIVE 4-like [Punica granatum]|uniref:Major facilitator superfamily (MFS) profile domain-containing protein n=2 Tax=Punica granatum TaxID=22663 RepID=A0A218Y0Y0_PUNGR|nr:protein NUCLEAR FUSION DEFECTIVE 4-like [Punica granatum]OWM90451.1 hypothetical protein CDL15_Pgr014754 [Punica granatum]PKI78032.1 hypothetical protein CRG98_001652 [Punica granatum]
MERIDNRWVSTAASIWIQCATGASYTFGIYSSTLKSSQSYSQSTLDTVSVFKDIGANAGVLSGLLYSAVASSSSSNRHLLAPGPWLVHLAGAIQFFVGYFLIWAAVVGLIPRPPVPVMCLFMWVAAHAQTFYNTSNVVSGVHNFSDYSGTIVGIMKGFLGLSGAVLIQVYYTLFKNEPSNFILMLALFPTAVSLLLMLFVRIYDTNARGDKKHLNSFSAVALTIAAYLMVLIILENVLTLAVWFRIITFCVLLLLIFWPLRVAVAAMRQERIESDRFLLETNPLLSSSRSEPGKDTEEAPSQYPASSSNAAIQNTREDMNIIQAMCTGNFWLLFIAMVCGLGSGLATINNISQIGESLGYTTVEISTLVSLLSIWNFLGRFGAGFISDILLYRKGWARPLLMAIMLFIMTGGHVIIASGFSGNLYIGSTIIGVCYGSLWSLMPTITSEIFGVGHMGTIFNTIAIGSPVGSYILSVRVIGYIYDKEATGDDDSCYGTHCFMLSFLILASVAFFGFLVNLVLFFQTRSFYEQVLHRRSKHLQGHGR